MWDSTKLFNMDNLPFLSETRTKPFLARETPRAVHYTCYRMYSVVKSESQIAWIVMAMMYFGIVLLKIQILKKML